MDKSHAVIQILDNVSLRVIVFPVKTGCRLRDLCAEAAVVQNLDDYQSTNV
jgi:hypothetical protein